MEAPPLQLTSDRIQYSLYAFTRSQILFTALDLDIFTEVERGNNTLESLVSVLHTDERGLRILLDGLIGIGFLKKSDINTYQLTPDVQNFLVKDSPSYMGGMVHHCKRLYENWGSLTEAVRTGRPAGGAQSLDQLEIFFSELVKGLYVSNYPTAQKLAKLLGMGKSLSNQHILDVAGGSAVWSIALLEQDPGSRATVLDLPSVTEVSREFVAQHGLTDRYDYIPGDLEIVEFPVAAFDMAVLGNICHALGPYSTEKLLKNMGVAIKSGGKVAIVDFVPDDMRARPGWPLIFGVNMLISTPEGDVFTAAQYRQWLEMAGFTNVQQHEIEPGVTLILADKA